MKSFRQYITENSFSTPPYPWSHTKLAGWWHPVKNNILWPWNIDGEEFHVTHIARTPHIFESSHDEIKNIINGKDENNLAWRKYFGWDDKTLHDKLKNGTIDVYPPIESVAYKKNWVAVRRTDPRKISLTGHETGLKRAVASSSLFIHPYHMESAEYDLIDAEKNKNFTIRGSKQIERYIKYGTIPSH
jgi:hypothetical protein